MNFFQKVNFQAVKFVRMVWYSIRYTIHPFKTIDGITIPVHLKYGYSVLRFIDNKKYESGEITIIKKTLKKDDRVLELGTGLGFISAFCAKNIGSANVFTFEANSYLKQSISDLYIRNHVNPALKFNILGKENKIIFFYVNKNSLLASGLQRTSVRAQRIEAKQENLNEKIKDIKPTYLIMDIEGGEYDIIKEIEFQTIHKVQFELHPDVLDKKKVSDIFLKLESSGFKRNESLSTANNYYFFK